MISVETPQQRDDRIHNLFNTLDVNKQGKLDATSVIAGVQSLESHPWTSIISPSLPAGVDEDLADQWISQVDPQSQGEVDFPSFRNYVLTTEVQLSQVFKSIDQTQNGKLTCGELKSALEYMGIKVDDDTKLQQFFDLINSKHNDGFITFEEWRDFLLFMPSLVDDETSSVTGSSSSTHAASLCQFDCPPLKIAYLLFIEELDLSSEGDAIFSWETLQGVGYFVAGGVAGVISRTCTAPLDRLKVYLIANTAKVTPGIVSKELAGTIAAQRAATIASQGSRTAWQSFKIMLMNSQLGQAAQHIYNRGGYRAFFVGNGLNICKVIPESAIKFGSFEAAKKFFCTLEGVPDTSELSRTSTFIAGGIGGMASQFAVYPVDTLKFRIQCEALSSDLSGNRLLIHTMRKMWADGGLLLFYRGLWVGVGGIFPFAALDLGTFAAMKRAYINAQAKREGCDPSEIQMGNIVVLSMGAFSGSVGASVVYPINLLRTRLQAQGTAAHPFHYDGFTDVFRKTVARDGYKGLFRGLAPNLAKVAPAVSISYLVYENAKRIMRLE